MEFSKNIDGNKFNIRRKSDWNNNIGIRWTPECDEYNSVGLENRQYDCVNVEDEQYNFVKVEDEQCDYIKVEDDQYNFVKVEDVQYKVEDERYNVVNVEDDQSIVEEEQYDTAKMENDQDNRVRDEDEQYDIEYDHHRVIGLEDKYNSIEIEEYNNIQDDDLVTQEMDSPDEIVVGSTFSTFFTFSNAFKNWCKKYYHPMRTQNSVKTHDGNTDYPYSYIVYTCIHCGKARRRSKNLRRNQKFFGCECPVKVSVSLIRKPVLMYRISAVMSQHKNHPCGPEYFSLYPKLRLLHRYEQIKSKDLMKCDVSAEDWKRGIWDKTGKCFDSSDIENFSIRYESMIDGDDMNV